MSDLYDRLSEKIDKLEEEGFEPDKVVIEADKWHEVKEQATVQPNEGFGGGDLTLVNGVKAVWSQITADAEIQLKVEE